MRLALLALVLSVGVACELVCAGSHSNSRAWRHFKRQHGKVYATQEEEARRFAIFMANKKLIESHNANASRTFDMGLNHMADWTDDEYARLSGLRPVHSSSDIITGEELAKIVGQDAPVPEWIDWRQQENRVSEVKNQFECGSCWAFATTGLLEGQQVPQNMSKLVSLSEQELVDCSESDGGCNGGLMSSALDDLANQIGGIEADSDYPYFGVAAECITQDNKYLPLKINGHKMLPAGDEETLTKVVANYGPVAVGIQATDNFKSYAKGIFEDTDCKAKQANHAVLVVGYNQDPKTNVQYWIVKNSWSNLWGEEGYIRMKRGSNMCGIADMGTIATFR